MDMVRILSWALGLVLVCESGLALGAGFITPEGLKRRIFEKSPTVIIDLQDADEFEEHNYEGSLPFPLGLGLSAFASKIANSKEVVIVVSPVGGEDAQGAVGVLTRAGVGEPRIFVLQGGMEEALREAGRADCCNIGGEPR